MSEHEDQNYQSPPPSVAQSGLPAPIARPLHTTGSIAFTLMLISAITGVLSLALVGCIAFLGAGDGNTQVALVGIIIYGIAAIILLRITWVLWRYSRAVRSVTNLNDSVADLTETFRRYRILWAEVTLAAIFFIVLVALLAAFIA